MSKLTEADKLAIVASRAAGVAVNEIAKRHRVSRQTIHSVLSVLKKGRPEAQEEFDAIVYRNRLRRKSYTAVEAGLDDQTDSYRRGTLGISFLKGVGDLRPDQTHVNVNALINACPVEWRDRYFVTASNDANDDDVDTNRNENS